MLFDQLGDHSTFFGFGQELLDDPGFAAASGVRMGTQEMTRYGMNETDFQELADLVAEMTGVPETKPTDSWRERVRSFRSRFTEMQYCF